MKSLKRSLVYALWMLAIYPNKSRASETVDIENLFDWQSVSQVFSNGHIEPNTLKGMLRVKFSKKSERNYTYPDLLKFLTSPTYSEIEGEWDIDMAHHLISIYKSDIPVKDIKHFYRVALRDRSEDYDSALAPYMASLILLDWQLSPHKKTESLPQTVVSACERMLGNENVSLDDKNALISLLYINQHTPLKTPILAREIKRFVWNNGHIQFEFLIPLIKNDLVDLTQTGGMINLMLLALSGNHLEITDDDKIDLTRALLETPAYVEHFLKHSNPEISKKHRKILSKFAYIYEEEGQIKHKSPKDAQNLLEGTHLPEIDDKHGADLSSVYQAWLDSTKTTLTVDNAYFVLYPPYTKPDPLQKHSEFLEKFLSTPDRLLETDLKYLDLWGLIEDPSSSDYKGYQDIGGEWRTILWREYHSLPKVKSGEYLPNLSHIDATSTHKCEYEERFRAWLSSEAVVTRENYQQVFTPRFPKSLISLTNHGDFLVKFLSKESRSERTNLRYEDIERILNHLIYTKIPGNWQDVFLKNFLPKVIFRNGAIITHAVHRLVTYLEENSLSDEMISSIIKALDKDNLTCHEKNTILEILVKNRSYLRYYELLDASEKAKYIQLTLKIQNAMIAERLIAEQEINVEKDSSVSVSTSTPTPPKPIKKTRIKTKPPVEPVIIIPTPVPSPKKTKEVKKEEKQQRRQERASLRVQTEESKETRKEALSSPETPKELSKIEKQRLRAENLLRDGQYAEALSIAENIIKRANATDDDYFRIIQIKGEIRWAENSHK